MLASWLTPEMASKSADRLSKLLLRHSATMVVLA